MWCKLCIVHWTLVFIQGVFKCEFSLSGRKIPMLIAADELFDLVSSETLEKCS